MRMPRAPTPPRRAAALRSKTNCSVCLERGAARRPFLLGRGNWRLGIVHLGIWDGVNMNSHAAGLHKEDRQIRQEERSMASRNGGHITKQEQRTLNQQENGVSKQIGK